MKKEIPLVLMLLFFVGLIKASDNIMVEFGSDLNEAKRQAGIEGKLYVVEFMTDRCYPCKMMDEVTFANKHVVDYIQQNYIPVKVNVEYFEGQVWREKYDIRVVPTIMIFNSQGQAVAKYEEAIGSGRMYNILNEHNRSSNRTVSEIYIPPALGIPPASPPVPEISSPATPTPEVFPGLAPSPPTSTRETIGDAIGLFEFEVRRADPSGYGVQVGAYARYDNVLRAVERLKRQFNQQILINIYNLRGRVVYRVIAGGFVSYNSASDFKHQISTQGAGYFVVDLAQI